MTVVLGIPEPLSSSSLGPHSVTVESLVLQNLLSVKKKKKKRKGKKMRQVGKEFFELMIVDYNYSKYSNKITEK